MMFLELVEYPNSPKTAANEQMSRASRLLSNPHFTPISILWGKNLLLLLKDKDSSSQFLRIRMTKT